MAGEWRVQVTGLKELQSALKRLDADLPAEVKRRFLDIAGVVASKASQTVPRRDGLAAGSVKPHGTLKGASVTGGGARVPYYPWLDFGGKVGRNKSIVRPFNPGGRYIYPAAYAERENTMNAAQDAIKAVARKAGFGVEEGL